MPKERTPEQRLVDDMRALFAAYEGEQGPTDAGSRTDARLEQAAPALFALARTHAAPAGDTRDEEITRLAGALTLDEAGTLRRAAKALEQRLPELVLDARIDGAAPPEIARRLLVTESYVYRILRENPWQARWRIDGPTAGKGGKPKTGSLEVFKDSAEQVAQKVLANTQRVTRGSTLRVWREGEDEPRVENKIT